MANILYLGDSCSSSTSSHRANALIRLGHTVLIKDPYKKNAGILRFPWLDIMHYRTGYRSLQYRSCNWLSSIINPLHKIDLVWVDGGELFGTKSLKIIKTLNCPIILYNIDDPTGGRDGRKFDSLLQAIPFYDLLVVVRKETAQECKVRGAKKVLHVLRSYDEVAHKPITDMKTIPLIYKSDVVFIGTWMRHEKRDEFLIELIKQGVSINIWGNRWSKSPYWNFLKHYHRGGALSGINYVFAIQGAKICLGLLSKGNRDLHTTRSLEVPFAGGLLCGERTYEHQQMYQDGLEAVFWSDANECANICKKLLNDDCFRENIRLAGMQKVRTLELGNEDVCKAIIDLAL